ncbi:hypothetical protein LWI28_018420 [Acer negundo]|uniref:GDP-D-glucose phosphorylase 1 n=1 Tax=Acer negundo TaxID=4023 RepID=A0AAD5IFZ5_ACENE|nr:hypothetical protein LWI28_018420 [Acer negundo]KAK4839870.1 hypothetical protein QYF36_025619 [Acer negundo]
MLTIKRVPTVVSNYQEDEEDSLEVGCGQNCLGKCCLPVSKLPLYAFKREREDSVESSSSEEEPQTSNFLHDFVLGQWKDRMREGLFPYDVTACETRITPGKYAFIAQLNEGRHLKKRPTEFRVDQVLQPFNDDKFNFTKVGQEEVLFRFEESFESKSLYSLNAPVHAESNSNSPSVVAINVSPIEYGHVLLIPRVLDCLPQRIDHASFLLALQMAKEAADPFFRLGYNSLGAFATINHLHFQAYYLRLPFPVEKSPTSRIIVTKKGLQDSQIMVSQLTNYPVRGLAFEGGKSMTDLSNAVASSCALLQKTNIPFNVLISDCGKRIFLFPQCYAEKQALGEANPELLETQVNPAVWEISGHIVLKRRKDFEEASEESAWRLLAQVSLSKERFQEVKGYILETAGLQESDTALVNNTNQEEVSLSNLPAPHASHLPQNCMVRH